MLANAPQDYGRSQSDDGRVLYVGPTLPKLNLQRNTVYTSVPLQAIAAIAGNEETETKGVPELGALFISITKYPFVDKSMRARSGFYYRTYQTVARKLGGEAL